MAGQSLHTHRNSIARQRGRHGKLGGSLLLALLAISGCSDEHAPATPAPQSAEPAQAAAVAPAASTVEQATAQPRTPADLSSACQPAAAQAIAATLATKVTVQDVANGAKFGGGVRLVAATEKLPAFCQVTGSFVTNPATGKTANFLATFPANWNGKYLQMGCSGHCGHWAVSDPAQPLSTITNQGLPFDTIVKGYASFATDEGHQGFSGGDWATKGPGQVDEDAIEDFYYRADQLLAGMGKEFTKAFYAEATKAQQSIAYSYFNGCSGGGRDAFVAASYFPEAFDGIIGGSAYNLTPIAFHAAGIATAQLRSQDALPSAVQINLIDPIVKAKCDKLDGVADGLIQNPAACDFRPERDLPRCEGNTPSEQCFTQAQLETISTVLTAVTDEAGRLVQPAYSVSELQRFFIMPKRPDDLAAKDPWPSVVGSPATSQGGGLWSLADAVLKVFVHKNDPAFFTRSLFSFRDGGPGPVKGFRIVVPGDEVAKAIGETRKGMGHVPENVTKFIEQDRKFLVWHNLSDEKLTPYMSINWYKQLAALHGGYAKLQDNVRLFSLPGTAHCSGGGMPVGPGSFDPLTAMENWVEKGEAPDSLVATLYQPTPIAVDFNKPLGRTMPLCKFPEMARYSGTGDVNDAANWSCPADDTRMLQVGESGRQAGVIE